MKHGLYLATSDFVLIAQLIEDRINSDECIYNDTRSDDAERLRQVLLLFIDNCEQIEGKSNGSR